MPCHKMWISHTCNLPCFLQKTCWTFPTYSTGRSKLNIHLFIYFTSLLYISNKRQTLNYVHIFSERKTKAVCMRAAWSSNMCPPVWWLFYEFLYDCCMRMGSSYNICPMDNYIVNWQQLVIALKIRINHCFRKKNWSFKFTTYLQTTNVVISHDSVNIHFALCCWCFHV